MEAEEKITTLKGLYHGNDVDFRDEVRGPVLDAEGNLKKFGMAYSTGWDIPTLWAIDHDNACWANDAHGGYLVRVEPGRLLGELSEDEREQANVRKLLGMKAHAPRWMAAALAAGWTPPPEGFDRDEYEW